MNVDSIQSKNKLPILYIDQPGAKAATVQIWFRAGSALENKDEQGVAHFLEHMFFKGTKLRPGHQIAHEVESFGGEINAFTSFDYTCYYINCPNSKLVKTVDILMDMVSDPQFLVSEIGPEKAVVHEEFKRAVDNPGQYHFMQLQEKIFSGPYSHPILGTEESIQSFDQEQLKNFRKTWYVRENCMLVIAGDLKKKKELIKKVDNFSLPSGTKSSFSKFQLKSTPQLSIYQKDVQQITVSLMAYAPSYEDKAAPAEDLALNCLAYGDSSLLYQELVEKSQLANSISGHTMYFSKGSFHMLRATCQEKKLPEFFKKLGQLLEQAAGVGMTSDNILRVKNQYLSSRVYEKESLESYAFSLGHSFAQNGDIYCEEKFIDAIRAVPDFQVNSALIEVLKRPFHLVIQGPRNLSISTTRKLAKGFLDERLKKAKKFNRRSEQLQQESSRYDSSVTTAEIAPHTFLCHRLNEASPTFVLHAYARGGLSNESNSNNGIYALLARSWVYGHNGLSYEKLRDDLEMKAASLSGFSGKNSFGLHAHGQTVHFHQLLNHTFKTFFNPKFPAKYVNLEKKLMIQHLKNLKEDPVRMGFAEFSKLMFPGHPYGRPTMGTAQNLRSFKSIDLLALHQNSLKKSPVLFTYCGDLGFEEVSAALRAHVSKIKRPKVVPVPKSKSVKPKSGIRKDLHFKREQTHIIMGTSSGALRDKDHKLLILLDSFLSGQSSDLFVEVRDKLGLCYTVQPIHLAALEGGYWAIYIGTGNEKKDLAVQAITKILENLADNGIGQSEFLRLKTMLQGKMQLSLQTNEDYANFYSIPFFQGLGLDYSHKLHEEIQDISLESFNLFCRKFLKKPMNTIYMGPSKPSF